jgi:signal transduction histidine kinase
MDQFVFSSVEPCSSVARAEGEVFMSENKSKRFDDLAHELRQPLSVIESLAYYLELTSADTGTAGHLRKIQAMVWEVNRILATARA